jgi:TPR repeat protein
MSSMDDCPLCGAKIAKAPQEMMAQLQKRVDHGDLSAYCVLAQSLWGGVRMKRDLGTAFRLNLNNYAGSRGHVEGQYALRNHVVNGGGGVPQNNPKAAKWFARAASQGHPRAQFELKCLYREGHGVDKDIAKAVGFYRQSAQMGVPQSALGLGLLYFQGWGVERNFEKGALLLHKAADVSAAADLEPWLLCVSHVHLEQAYENGMGIRIPPNATEAAH